MPPLTTPLRFSDVDVSRLRFTSAARGRQGGANLVIEYAPGGGPMAIQTPPLNLRFGITKWTEPYLKYTMDLSFKTMHSCQAAADFLQWYKDLDAYVKQQAVLNSVQWFREQLAADQVEAMFCSSLKVDQGGRYEPNLRFNLGSAGGTCAVPFFNAAREAVSIDDVAKGCNVMCVAELTGIWFFNRQWGLKWRVVQAVTTEAERARARPPPRAPEGGFAFRPGAPDGGFAFRPEPDGAYGFLPEAH